jgi:phycocyanin-associated, rod
MTTTTVCDLSDYSSRSLLVEVIGMNHAAGVRTSNYRIKVPYSSLAQTMQNIRQRGGKVANVTSLSQDILGEPQPLESGSKVADVVTLPSPTEPVISGKTTTPTKTKTATKAKTTTKTTSKSSGSDSRSTGTRQKN